MPQELNDYLSSLQGSLNDSLNKMRSYTINYSAAVKKAAGPLLSDLEKFPIDEMSIKQIKDEIKSTLIKRNFSFDKLGRMPILCKDDLVRYYNPDRWSDTIARTYSRKLQEEGRHKTMLNAGFDLVVVSISGSTDACKKWEGKILSISGATPGYPTVAEAEASKEIFHYNCTHVTFPFIVEEKELKEPDSIISKATPKKVKDDLLDAISAGVVLYALSQKAKLGGKKDNIHSLDAINYFDS